MKKSVKVKKEILNDVKITEDLINVPTMLNVARVVLTFVIAYMIVTDVDIIMIVIVFSIAALTDWFDGYTARKYNLTNEFGRKADMFADRFLWVGTSLAFVFVYGIKGKLMPIHGLQILFIMTREIISSPFAIAGVFGGSVFPKTRYVAKITTFLQGIALPTLLLSVSFPIWIYISLPISILVGITGALSGLHYIHDLEIMRNSKYVGTR